MKTLANRAFQRFSSQISYTPLLLMPAALNPETQSKDKKPEYAA
jgi:hypothetical protein